MRLHGYTTACDVAHIAGGWDRWVVYHKMGNQNYCSAHVRDNWIVTAPESMEWLDWAMTWALICDAFESERTKEEKP